MLADIQKLEHAARLAMGSLEVGGDPEHRRPTVFTTWAARLAAAIAATVFGVRAL